MLPLKKSAILIMTKILRVTTVNLFLVERSSTTPCTLGQPKKRKPHFERLPTNIPAVSFALCVVEFAERASYYGVITVFSNFMQFPLPAGGNGAGATPKGTQETSGALGLGLQFSNAFVLLFTFLAYVIPILGAWIADTRLGRYETIAIGVLICGIAHVILIFGAIPSVLQAGHGLAAYLIGFFILAFGAGMYSSKPVCGLSSNCRRYLQAKYCSHGD